MGKNKAPKIDTQTPPVDGLTLAPAPVHKKRGRTHLTEADKAHMQACRVLASEGKKNLAAILIDPSITSPEVWEGLPSDQFDLIAGVVQGVKAFKANASLNEAREQYETACKENGETPDPTLLGTVPRVDAPNRHKYSEGEKMALAKARAASANPVTIGRARH
jgi:hypothetical protein